MKMIFLTGATGFVGKAVVWRLAADPSFNGVVAAVRRKAESLPEGGRQGPVGELLQTTDFSTALRGIDAVVHCAGRVHVMQDDAIAPLLGYRKVNVSGTLTLARQAADAGGSGLCSSVPSK
jgi:nucleoside-diphosphate-sugar epimerase